MRATLLLVQAFAEQCPGDGRIVLFTSGQHLGPMPAELPYVATKGALHQLTLSLSDALIDAGITVNCLNPGPTDTGWADEETRARGAHLFPRGRWNTPAEAAGVVALLLGRRRGCYHRTDHQRRVGLSPMTAAPAPVGRPSHREVAP